MRQRDLEDWFFNILLAICVGAMAISAGGIVTSCCYVLLDLWQN